MHILADAMTFNVGVFLVLAVGLALSFEFVNGFHDTANAVATVIYTHSLPPNVAVIWSGIWNLIGVLCSDGAVAFGIVSLLPVELVINVGSTAGFAMVFALLISAIIWNLGTWYLGLPASSSHTLIGAILGVGLGNSFMTPGHVFGEGVNWAKAGEVGLSLIVSPIIGFVCAALLLLLTKALIRSPELYKSPEGKPPPGWIRGLLVATCTGVSYAHGSNDGQKGMGLIMLILVGILPGTYALKMDTNEDAMKQIVVASQSASESFEKLAAGRALPLAEASAELSRYSKTGAATSDKLIPALAAKSREINVRIKGLHGLTELPEAERRGLRTDFYLVAGSITKLNKAGGITEAAAKESAGKFATQLGAATKYIPNWVKYAVAFALGLGTMIGWKRIVVTVGEKIGKDHLTYAQGASAELVTMCTIGAADYLGLPVSTTHVLSSGVAGTMAANKSGLQMNTVRNLLIAWVLTLPVCIFLGASIFSFALYVLLNVLGLK